MTKHPRLVQLWKFVETSVVHSAMTLAIRLINFQRALTRAFVDVRTTAL